MPQAPIAKRGRCTRWQFRSCCSARTASRSCAMMACARMLVARPTGEAAAAFGGMAWDRDSERNTGHRSLSFFSRSLEPPTHQQTYFKPCPYALQVLQQKLPLTNPTPPPVVTVVLREFFTKIPGPRHLPRISRLESLASLRVQGEWIVAWPCDRTVTYHRR